MLPTRQTNFLFLEVGHASVIPCLMRQQVLARISHSCAAISALFQTCRNMIKKQLLVRSADPKVGDFHLTVTALVQRDYYRDATFDEIVTVLDNIYVEKKTLLEMIQYCVSELTITGRSGVVEHSHPPTTEYLPWN